jgi:hypothetical protein
LEESLEFVKDSVGEKVVFEEFPDHFLEVEFRTRGRGWENRDILRNFERSIARGSIQDHHSTAIRRNNGTHRLEMEFPMAFLLT